MPLIPITTSPNSYLLTPEEFATYRNISIKRNDDKINECIRLAQSVDLYDIFDTFLFDMVQNASNSTYEGLFNGSSFIINDVSYIHDGIKSLLADLTYARYMYVINTNHTPHGFVQKMNDNSEPIDRNFIKDIVKQTQIDASVKAGLIKKYLSANTDTFTHFKSNTNNPDINTFGTKITIIK
jgi:hypothetical protein